MDTRRRIAAALVPVALTMGAGCAKPAAAPAPTAPAPARAEEPPSARTSQANCDGTPCLVTVELTGNRGIPSAEIFAMMSVLEHEFFHQEWLERDEVALNALYYDRGYLGVEIPHPTVDHGSTPLGRAVRIRVSINEGIRYRLGSLEVYEDRRDVRCPPMGGWSSALRPGDWFDRRQLVWDLGRLQTTYRDQGYADVEARPRMDLDPERRVVALKVPVIRGAVRSFGQVRLFGNKRVTRAELRPWIEVVEGARFSETALERTKLRLLESGLFAEVHLSTESGGASGVIHINIEVSERSPSWPPAPAPPPVTPPPTPAKAPEEADPRTCRAAPSPDEIGARHILVMHAGSKQRPEGVTRSRDEARRRAQEARALIRGGATFEATLKAYSDEPGGVDQGGALGRFGREVMVEKFSTTAFKLRVGEISEVVETAFGFHIIQRTE